MATIDDAIRVAQEEDTIVDSVVAFVQKLLSGEVLSPTLQAKVDQLVALSESGKKKLSDAITANTAAAGTP